MEQSQGRCGIYLWIVLGITCVQRNGLQVKTAVQVDCSHNVPFQEKESQPMVSLGWEHKETQGLNTWENTHCKVGTMPLGLFWVAAPGVAAGVAGVTPLPSVAFPPVGCWPLTAWASFSDEGGVRSPAPPGKEREDGEVKARACCALEGWVVRESMMGDSQDHRDRG